MDQRQLQHQPAEGKAAARKARRQANRAQLKIERKKLVKEQWEETERDIQQSMAFLALYNSKQHNDNDTMRTVHLPIQNVHRYLGENVEFDARARDLASTNHEAASQMVNGCRPSANLFGMFVGVLFYGTELLSLTPSSLVTNATASFNNYGVRKVTFNSLPKLRDLCQKFEQYNFVELLTIESLYAGPYQLANPGYTTAVRASGAHTLKEIIEQSMKPKATLIKQKSAYPIRSNTQVGNENNKDTDLRDIDSSTIDKVLIYLGKLASICATASVTVDYLDLYNHLYKQHTPLTKFHDQLLQFIPPGQRDMDVNDTAALAQAIWPQMYPFSTIMFTDMNACNNTAGYYKTLSRTYVKKELIFKKLLPKFSKQLRGLVFAVVAVNSNENVDLNELWNIVCKQPGIEQLTARQESDVINNAGIPDVDVDNTQDEDEVEVENEGGKKVFVDKNNIPLCKLLKTNSQFTVGDDSTLNEVVEGVVSVFVDQFGKDIVNYARRKFCHNHKGNPVDCSKVLVALYSISFFQASFFLGLDKTGRFIPDLERSHYAQMLAIDNYNEVPTVTSAREINAEFMQLLQKRFPALYVLPAVPGDHKTTNIPIDYYRSLASVSDNAPKNIKKRKTK